MPDLLIRNVPKAMQNKIKKRAAVHHRSMNKEIYAILEEALKTEDQVRDIPEPYEGTFNLTQSFIKKAKHEGRE